MSMASFKAHCAVIFPKASLLKDGSKVLEVKDRSAMGHLGKIRDMGDLPPDKILTGLMLQAEELNRKNIKVPRKAVKKPMEISLPADFKKALNSDRKARDRKSVV